MFNVYWLCLGYMLLWELRVELILLEVFGKVVWEVWVFKWFIGEEG